MKSNYKITNLVFPNFSHEFFSARAVEKKNNLSIGSKQIYFLGFGPVKSLFSFQMLKLRIVRWKNLGKKDWWFDVTNKIVVTLFFSFLKKQGFCQVHSSSIFQIIFHLFLFDFEKCANELYFYILETKFESKFDYCAIRIHYFIWWWAIS